MYTSRVSTLATYPGGHWFLVIAYTFTFCRFSEQISYNFVAKMEGMCLVPNQPLVASY